MMAIRALPLRDGWRMRVSLESRKLMCDPEDWWPRATMTRERVSRLWLILPPSFWRSPVAPVWRTDSDPACG